MHRSFLFVLLVACAPEDATTDGANGGPTNETTSEVFDTHACAHGELTVALGTGITEYQPLDPGDEVMMVDGPQSGWHMDVAGLLIDAPEVVQVDVAVFDAQGQVWFGDQATNRIALVGWDDSACEGSFYGVRAMSVPQLDIDTVCALAGQPATVEVTVTDLFASNPEPVTEVLGITFELDPKDDDLCR